MDDVTCPAADAVWVTLIVTIPQTGKVSVWITVYLEIVTWGEDEALI